jgi:hypothetical protein
MSDDSTGRVMNMNCESWNKTGNLLARILVGYQVTSDLPSDIMRRFLTLHLGHRRVVAFYHLMLVLSLEVEMYAVAAVGHSHLYHHRPSAAI